MLTQGELEEHYQKQLRQEQHRLVEQSIYIPFAKGVPTQADLDHYYYGRAEQRRKFKVAFDPYDNNPYAGTPDPDKWSQPSGRNYQSYQLTEAEREYEMRRSEVVKQLGPPPDARYQFNRWVQSINEGAPPAAILGTSINLKLDSTHRGSRVSHHATVVRGYRILSVVLQGERDPEIGVLACYSPLLKDLVGEPFRAGCGSSTLEFNPCVEVYLHQIPDLKREAVEPLTDMQSKRIRFYKELRRAWHHTESESSLYHRALHPHIDPIWFLTELACPHDRDPVLAAAGYLKSYPANTLKKLWADYDRWGPIDNLYGAAMIHLDKFRSW